MANKGTQQEQGDWVTMPKKAQPKGEKVYAVFAAKLGQECHIEVNNFPGACYLSYDSMTKARSAFASIAPTASPIRPFGNPR